MPNNREAVLAPETFAAALIGVTAAAVSLIEGGAARWATAGSLLAALAMFAIFLRPNRWLILFFAVDILAPPLGGGWGNAGIHPAAAAAGIGLLAGALRLEGWRLRRGPMLALLGALVFSLTASLPPALLYSGEGPAIESALRIGLLLIGVYVFCYALCGPGDGADERMGIARFLFILASIAAGFACLDFYLQFPAPSGFSEQYVWLDNGVFRRAQGLFYDASTLGNFCAFFLIYGFIAFFERPAHGQPGRIVLASGMVLLAGALILSYSRASVVNLACAVGAYAMLRGARLVRILAAIAAAGGMAAILIRFALPSFATGYWGRIAGSFQYFIEQPDSVLSGRLTTWGALFRLMASHPWQTVFGIGYKTLPYTAHFGDPLVADNTYLSLLVETGIAGLGSFVLLLRAILKSALGAARSASPRASLLGKWAFCFWCGQTVQMLSGDLLTYWRVLPLYFWALAAALREGDIADENSLC